MKLWFVLPAISAISVFAQLPGGTGQGYGGPGILSRGGVSGSNAPNEVGIHLSGSLSFVYDTGLLPISVDQNGNLLTVNAIYGVEASLSAAGIKNWKRSVLQLGYTGNYHHYSQNSYFDGSDHSLSLMYNTQLTKRFAIRSQLAGGTSSFALSSYSGWGTPSLAPLGIPTAEIFDNRVYFVETSDQLIYQKSARLSFSFGGQAFGVRHQAKELVGVNGYGAIGTIAYRVNRLSTLDLSYNYSHFDYPKAFGEADVHSMAAGYSRTLNKIWQFNIQAGAFYVDTVGIQSVAASPAIAALFGQSTIIEAFNARKVYPTATAALSGHYKKSNFSISYGRSPNPGNGVYLASVSDSAGVSYTYATTRNLSLSASAAYSRLESVGQTGLGNYSYWNGGGGLGYRLRSFIFASARFDARNSQISLANGLNQLGYRIALGLTFSPGTVPLAMW